MKLQVFLKCNGINCVLKPGALKSSHIIQMHTIKVQVAYSITCKTNILIQSFKLHV